MSNLVNTFMGRPFEYWIELQAQVDETGKPAEVEKLILQNVRMRARISFYEQQAREATEFMKSVGDLK